ncbi:transposase [Staphylococcus aureus subsp. aureus CIG2018]|nr:transposase [Staphylococcus aureus subsp. aureus CIG2018]
MLRNTIYYPAFNNGAIEGINNKIKINQANFFWLQKFQQL